MKMRVTYVLIATNVFVFLMGWQWPLHSGLWSLFGYGFSHANWLHLGFNMLALLTFGLGLERKWGPSLFAQFYLACIMWGGVIESVLGNGAPVIGASGGVFGLLVAYGVLFPDRKVLLLVFPMSARALVAWYVVIELGLLITGWAPGIAHWAHLGGAIGAGLQLWVWRICSRAN